jgi:hypothetical protein
MAVRKLRKKIGKWNAGSETNFSGRKDVFWWKPIVNKKTKKVYTQWWIDLTWRKADKDWDGRGWVVNLTGKNKKRRKVRFSNKAKAMEWIKDFKKRH